jgi:putative endonuclease
MWHVYIIECKDGKLYTGVTTDLKRRLREHQYQGSHFTSYNPIKKFLYSEISPTKKKAEIREAQIKRWSRCKKIALIKGDLDQLQKLSRSRD